MAGSKYTDTTSAVQVIGCMYKNPSLLEDGRYFLTEEDFTNDFHKVVFGAINNLYGMGSVQLNLKIIDDYLQEHPKSYAIYKTGNGANWLKEQEENADLPNFEYYYNRLKKFTILRIYDQMGLNVKWIYDPDEIFDAKKKEDQERYFDELTIDKIAGEIETRIENVRRIYIDNSIDDSQEIGTGIETLIEDLKHAPEAGTPMYGKYINTITRGMRLGKLYLRSAPTGVGKSRTMIADACVCACDELYDPQRKEWIKRGIKQPALYIATEQELDEVQTMALAFLACVDEEHILTGEYGFGEEERVLYAAKLLQQSPLYVEYIPDFTLKDIENCIKRHLRLHQVQHIFYDYVHTSMKMLEDISKRSGGVKLREDNLLFLLSVKLKDICTQFNVFILTSTQLNADWKHDKIPDQNLLRGAKSIADKADFGAILLDINEDDEEALAPLCEAKGYSMPNVKLSIYKNRRGSYNKGYLWLYADKSTCRFNGAFYTDFYYKEYPIGETSVIVSLD